MDVGLSSIITGLGLTTPTSAENRINIDKITKWTLDGGFQPFKTDGEFWL